MMKCHKNHGGVNCTNVQHSNDIQNDKITNRDRESKNNQFQTKSGTDHDCFSLISVFSDGVFVPVIPVSKTKQ